MSTMLSIDERPSKFSEMIGNKTIMKTLRDLSKTGDYPNVMVFAGDSGTGKTTAALIIAALLVDSNPIINPDGTKDPNPLSSTTISIHEERFNNNVEFFNAANMDKAAVLSLEESASSLPLLTQSSVKCIVVDEAQALSSVAKGATLKFLEKKRKNVYIILCTMDLKSFDKSIRSRGQVFEFKPPLPSEIAENLFNILEKRGHLGDPEFGAGSSIPDEFLEKGLVTIAENCEGSVRQSVQLLQRCLSGEIYSQTDILREFGLLSSSETASLLQDLLKKNPRGLASLEQLDLKESFYLFWKILTDAYLFKVNPKDESDWKSNQSRELSKSENLESLLMVFDETEQALRGYFRPAVFLTRLAKYYLNFKDQGLKPESMQSASPPTRERSRA